MEAPSRKVGLGATAGAISAILVWAAKAFGGVEIPGEIGSALTTILTMATSYFATDSE